MIKPLKPLCICNILLDLVNILYWFPETKIHLQIERGAEFHNIQKFHNKAKHFEKCSNGTKKEMISIFNTSASIKWRTNYFFFRIKIII